MKLAFFCCKRNDKDDKEDVYKATNDDKEENVYNNAKGDISGYEREDVYIKFYMREWIMLIGILKMIFVKMLIGKAVLVDRLNFM